MGGQADACVGAANARLPQEVLVSDVNTSGGIAVVGMACRFPGAATLVELWENVLAQRRQFRRFPAQRLSLADYGDPGMDAADRDKTYLRQAAFIDGFEFDWQGRRIPKSTFDVTDVVHWLALDVATQALADAPVIPKERRARTGVMLGNIMGGEQARAELLRLRWPLVRRAMVAAAEAEGSTGLEPFLARTEEVFKSVFAPITEDTITSQLANTIAGRICNYFDFHGGGYVVDGACASSLIAISTAATALQRGELDVALAGGVDVSLDIWELVSFSKIRALAPGDLAVYDRKSSGLLPGEGCGFVVLKRLEDAQAAGDRVYAVIRGWGISSDGKGGLTTPSVQGQKYAIERAYRRAPYGPRDLAFVEGHGTGTPVGDRIELEALGKVLGDGGEPAARGCGITSFKSLVGHTKGAAGIGGFLKAAIAVNRRVIPPTANCREPHPVFQDAALALYPIRRGSSGSVDEPMRAGVSSMGFGGINCHITLESGDGPAAELAPKMEEHRLLYSVQDSELFVVAKDSPEELAVEVARIRKLAAGMSLAELCDLSAQLASNVGPGAARGAIVASTPEELIRRLRTLEEMASTAPRAGEVQQAPAEPVWLGLDVHRERIGFLLPGQGSQRLNMAGTLIERHSWARELLDEADRVLSLMEAPTLTERMLRPLERAKDEAQLGAWLASLIDVEVSQPAITLTSILWAKRLERLGILPSVVCGHSQGEQTAFYLAGATDFRTAMELGAYTGRSGSRRFNDLPPGAMAIIGCDRANAARLVRTVGGSAAIAEINSPMQAVIAGETADVERAMALAASEGMPVRQLPVDNAFHTDVIASGVDYMRREAPAGEPVRAGGMPIVSSMDGVMVEPGTEPRAHFCRMSLNEVDFIAALATMSSKCDLMLEVGSGRSLTGLAGSCPGTVPCWPVESAPGRDADFNEALASLFVNGASIRWEALCEDRLVRPFVPASQKLFFANPGERPIPPVTRPSTSAPVALAGTGSLAAATGLSPARLERYLASRGGFLARVILADLDLPAVPADLGRVDGRSSTGTKTVQASVGAAAGPPKSKGVRPSAPPAAVAAGGEILARLISEVSQVTGFASESLNGKLRLLDDLNLDSLRAGEIIGKVASALGADGAIDPSAFANARLEEVEQAIRAAVPKVVDIGLDGALRPAAAGVDILGCLYAEVERATGFAVHTLTPALRLLDDLNLDSLRAGEIIGKVAASLGADGAIDPSAFANARLEEVEAAIRAVSPVAQQSGLPGGAAAPSAGHSVVDRVEGLNAFAFAAAGQTGLLAAIRTAQAEVESGSGLSLTEFAVRLARRLPLGRHRAVILAGTTEELAERLELLHARVQGESANDAGQEVVFYAIADAPARVGYLFPGQGSQKVGMARSLLARRGHARKTMGAFDTWLRAAGHEAVGDEMLVDPEQISPQEVGRLATRLRRTEVTQPAVCLASVLWLRELEQMGVEPVAVCGHSLGELAALHATGALDEDEVLRFAAVRGQACARPTPREGAMASLGCSAAAAREVVEEVAGYVIVANVNSPVQVVVSGDEAGVEEALKLAAARGIPGRRLNVSNAFHTELVAPAAEFIRKHAEVPEAFHGPRARFVSSMEGGALDDGARLRDHLARQLVAPIDFLATIQEMAKQVDLLVEVGTGRTLSRLAQAIIPEGGPPCLAVEAEPGREVDYFRLLAHLFVAGHDIRWELLPSDRADGQASSDEVLLSDYSTDLVVEAPPEPATTDYRGSRWVVLHQQEEADIAAAIVAKARQVHAEATAVLIGASELPAWRDQVAYTVLVLPRSEAPAQDPEARLRAWIAPLRAAAQWLPKVSRPGRGLLFVQFGGGRFGVGSDALEPCWATAHAASIHHEQPGLNVRVVDFDAAEQPNVIASRSLTELSGPGRWMAAGWDLEGVRREPRVVPMSPRAWPARKEPLIGEDVVLVTGGAKGITAECALAVARDSGAHLALLGRSPAVHPEVAATLARYAQEGLPVSYHVADTASAEQIARAVAEIRSTHGPISAVLHGAGMNRPGRVESSTAEAAAREVGPKVLGLLHLFNALADAPPRLIAALTSVIGVAGMAGNAWYAFSNEITDRLLDQYAKDHPGVDALTVAYGLWSEVGMGAQESTQAALKRLGLGDRFIRPSDGVGHFLRLVGQDPGVTRVAVTFDLSVLDTWRLATPPVAGHPEAPLLDTILVEEAGRRIVARVHTSLDRYPWLDHHLINGATVWPAVMSLELMAEACARLLGRSSIECLRGEELHLYRPIVIDAQGVTELEVSVELVPGSDPDAPRLHASLRPVSGPNAPAAEGTFVLPKVAPAAERLAPGPRIPLNFQPEADIYETGILFHGPRFRRLRDVYAMSEQRCAYSVEERPLGDGTSGLILGDPFFRDSALQGGVLMLLPFIALPVSLGVFEIRPRALGQSTTRHASATLDYVDEREGIYTLQVADADGVVLEKYTGAKVRFRGRLPDQPTTRELSDPASRDEWRLRRDVARSGLELPGLALAHAPGIHDLSRDERHVQTRGLMMIALGRAVGEEGAAGASISWNGSGAPHVDGLDEVKVSVSHTDDLALCVAAPIPVGCDLTPIQSRTREEWVALLGSHRSALLDELVALEEGSERAHLDIAGARIWAAVEAVRKIEALPEVGLSFISSERAGRRLKARLGARWVSVLTLPLLPERAAASGDSVMVAVATFHGEVVADEPVVEALAPPRVAAPDPRLDDLTVPADSRPVRLFSYDPELFSIGVDELPGKEHVFSHRFPLGMRDRAGFGGSVRYTNFHSWMGKVRELAVLPIFDRIAATLLTGEYGMVTNGTELTCIQPALGGDAMECHLRIAHADEEGVIDLLYDWFRVDFGGAATLVATSKMRTSWVRVLGHGVVKPDPLPDYFAEFVLAIPRVDEAPPARSSLLERGAELRSAPRSATAPALYEEVFVTTLDDGNLVGNIYFDRYSKWQSKVRDTWFFKHGPRLVAGPTPVGEWFCVGCRIEHLREAMPFDRVVVTMSVRALHECGAAFEFNYFKLDERGERQKLAVSIHDAVWLARGAEGQLIAARVPAVFGAALLDAIRQAEQVQAPHLGVS